VACERQRNYRALDGPRLDETQVAYAFEQSIVESQVDKCDRGRVTDRGFEKMRDVVRRAGSMPVRLFVNVTSRRSPWAATGMTMSGVRFQLVLTSVRGT
jgi:hypothetical protein